MTLWGDLATVRPEHTPDAETLIARARAHENVVAMGPESMWSSRPEALLSSPGAAVQRPRVTKRSLLLAGIAAAGALVVTAGWWQAHRAPAYKTEVGEQRSLKLGDGSTVQLNSRSRIRVRYSERERSIDLLQGQALFNVAKDARKPFIVRSDGVVVRAVGTRFDVYRKSTGTVITVVEGTVAVLPAQGSSASLPARPSSAAEGELGGGTAARGPQSARSLSKGQVAEEGGTAGSRESPIPSRSSLLYLDAGEQVIVDERSAPRPMPANVAEVTAWSQGKLVFRSVPLSSVVEEFNRYNTRRLVLDANAPDIPITAVFSSTDTQMLVEFLKDQPDFTVASGSREVHIRPRQQE